MHSVMQNMLCKHDICQSAADKVQTVRAVCVCVFSTALSHRQDCTLCILCTSTQVSLMRCLWMEKQEYMSLREVNFPLNNFGTILCHMPTQLHKLSLGYPNPSLQIPYTYLTTQIASTHQTQ
jgi:hypothetical protein